MDILLIAGLWLDRSSWDEVVPELERLAHRPVPVALPGQGDGHCTAALRDQIDAVVAAVDSADSPCVVGHSAACTLAWLAADARPEAVSRVVLIGGFPSADGERYADFIEPAGGQVAFPGWEPFEGPDAADLDPALREAIAARTIPVPQAVTQGVVQLTDERRYDVPVTLICPEFTPDQAREWIASGDLPELAKATSLELVDIPTGHWPMFSAPGVLARTIAAAVNP